MRTLFALSVLLLSIITLHAHLATDGDGRSADTSASVAAAPSTAAAGMTLNSISEELGPIGGTTEKACLFLGLVCAFGFVAFLLLHRVGLRLAIGMIAPKRSNVGWTPVPARPSPDLRLNVSMVDRR
jgi:hypothetical protein